MTVLRLASVLGCLACLAGVVLAEPALRDVAERFTEMEFTDDVHWGLIFRKDGRLISVQTGGRFTAVEGKPQLGKWGVRADQLCFGIGDHSRCHEVWVSGVSVQLRAEDGTVVDGVLKKPSLSR
jgi:hypothetical protein